MLYRIFSFSLLAALCGVFLLTGCSTPSQQPSPIAYALPVDPPPGADMLTANTYAGDAMAAMLLRRIGAGSGLLVTPLVDMEEIDSSSAFGRLSMQQISSRIGQHGFKVIEVRLGDTLRMIPGTGELMLTRDSGHLLAQEHDAHAVLVGMYSRTPGKVYISVRAIRLADSSVIASYEYYLPFGGDVASLLHRGQVQTDRALQDSANSAVWSHYSGRRQSFHKNTTKVTPASSAPVKKTSGQVEYQSGTQRPGGMVIDPNAKPMPFPGGSRKK